MREVDYWKIMYNNTVLGQVLTLVNGRTPRKIIKQALDGSVYVQTIGTAGHKIDVTALCTREELLLLNHNAAEANTIIVRYRGKQYYGFIEETPEVEPVRPGEWYNVSFSFLVDGIGSYTEVS